MEQDARTKFITTRATERERHLAKAVALSRTGGDVSKLVRQLIREAARAELSGTAEVA